MWSCVHSALHCAPASWFSRISESLGGPSSQLWDWQRGVLFSLRPQEKLVSGISALLPVEEIAASLGELPWRRPWAPRQEAAGDDGLLGGL